MGRLWAEMTLNPGVQSTTGHLYSVSKDVDSLSRRHSNRPTLEHGDIRVLLTPQSPYPSSADREARSIASTLRGKALRQRIMENVRRGQIATTILSHSSSSEIATITQQVGKATMIRRGIRRPMNRHFCYVTDRLGIKASVRRARCHTFIPKSPMSEQHKFAPRQCALTSLPRPFDKA